MSRAIGDADLKSFGVIATPDIVVHRLSRRVSSERNTKSKLVLVIATDGVWDTLSLAQCALLVQEKAQLIIGQTADSNFIHTDSERHEAGSSGNTIPLRGRDANLAEEAARYIVETAQPGTNDDVTAVVAVLCP